MYSPYANGTSTAPLVGTDSNYSWVQGYTWNGSARGALEQNGTKDMMGNTEEWNDAIIYEFEYEGLAYCGVRGGSFMLHDYYLQASTRLNSNARVESSGVGFRVSQVVTAYRISNKAAYDPIMSTASTKFNFKVWGKVLILVSGTHSPLMMAPACL